MSKKHKILNRRERGGLDGLNRLFGRRLGYLFDPLHSIHPGHPGTLILGFLSILLASNHWRAYNAPPFSK